MSDKRDQFLDRGPGERLARLFTDPMFAHDVGKAMTCDEADTLAGVLRELGFPSAAETFLYGHSGGDSDDEDDRHTGMADPTDPATKGRA